jgi:hypothetical protein
MKYILVTIFLLQVLLISPIHQDEGSTNFLQIGAMTETETRAHKLMDYLLEYEGVVANPLGGKYDLKGNKQKLFAQINKENHSFIIADSKKDGYSVVAEATYVRSRFEVGWDKLNIKTFESHNPILQCYAAGVLEGTLTHEEINYYFNNAKVFFMGEENTIHDIKDFYGKIDMNLKERINGSKDGLSQTEILRLSYISCLHAQIVGLHAGFSKNSDTPRDLLDFYFLNSEGNFGDLKSFMAINKMDISDTSKFYTNENLKKVYDSDEIEKIWKDLVKNGKCSAIIKLIKDGSGKYDLIAGHNTWTEYCEMLRSLKYFEWAFEGSQQGIGMKPRIVSFSSYPGVLFSGDDFYLLNSKVALLQTTLSTINKFAYKNLINVKRYIPEFMRIMISNFMSDSGKEWVQTYKSWPDHMYITQWVVIDYDVLGKMNSGGSSEGLVYLVEEVPGDIFVDDISNVIKEKTYFGSFNIAYFPQSSRILGMDNFQVDFYSAENDPRKYILDKLQSTINDVESFKKVIQYNGYKNPDPRVPNDPSLNDPSNGISSRGDLVPGSTSFHGGVDFKVSIYV